MTRLEDRHLLVRQIESAQRQGARLHQVSQEAGLSVRTLQRWKTEGGVLRDDGRPGAMRLKPSHALTAEERVKVLQVANEPRFAALPPARIVPMLADEGVYLASESTFARILRDQVSPTGT